MMGEGKAEGVFAGRRVFVTGHTGFKGSWLCEWLLELGAEVHGFALAPDTEPALFDRLRLGPRLASHTVADIRDRAAVAAAVAAARPDFIFHLAAQPLVRLSYRRPVETFAANLMGTVHLLDACRALRSPCAVVCVTTDKCYENREWAQAYRETDPMGGHDPYSASKGCCELAVASYRRSFFGSADGPVWVASARAGNVIGGGDWAEDRIVPDCMRALGRGEPVPVRNGRSTRPWQHVLEPLGGYLTLAARLREGMAIGDPAGRRAAFGSRCGAFNFGPGPGSNRTVAELVEELLRRHPGRWADRPAPGAAHEAGLLALAIDKARLVLGWSPRWGFERTVAETVAWYDAAAAGEDPLELTRRQIAAYRRDGARGASSGGGAPRRETDGEK